MALMLHLSDLHLGPGGTELFADDVKTAVVDDADRRRLIDTIRTRLVELRDHLRERGRGLDAVIITGDITVGAQEEGYKQLAPLLALLDDCLPARNRIVIVPGNHDVAWGTKPWSRERYELFERFVVKEHYVTPLLEGVDLQRNGAPSIEHHYVHDDQGNWAILPLNSTNWCGVVGKLGKPEYDALWNKNVEDLRAAGQPEAADAFQRLRMHDMPLLSKQQLDALKKIATTVRSASASRSDPPLLIVPLHHHLLPVSEAIEIKTFADIPNLGELRQRLAEQKVNVVLHGHKHTALVFWDAVANERATDDVREIMVVSSPSLAYNSDDPASLIEIDRIPSGHQVRVRSLREFNADEAVQRTRAAVFFKGARLTEAQHDSGVVLRADSYDDAYDKINAFFASRISSASMVHNLGTIVRNAASVAGMDDNKLKPPRSYPPLTTQFSDENVWFRETLRWWQSAQTNLPSESYFTHGARIRCYDGKYNQINQAVQALKRDKDARNGRAIVSLLNPGVDLQDANDAASPRRFPAFCLAQLYLTPGADGKRQLNVMGFFRKQEMKYWWPVNVAELGQVLREVCGALKDRDVVLGSISTITTLAHFDQNTPRVAIPRIDMTLDTNPMQLFELAYSVSNSNADAAQRAEDRRQWDELTRDFVPPDSWDDDLVNLPLPGPGLAALIKYLTPIAKRHPEDGGIGELKDILESIGERSRVFLADVNNKKNADLEKLRSGNKRDLSKLSGILDKLLPA